MSQFWIYIQLGWQHIADINAYDHLLFLVALCAAYRWTQWRQLLVLVTAFTVGHSLTLALSALDLVVIPSHIIEFLIPITILLTAVYTIFVEQKTLNEPSKIRSNSRFNYLMALIFGFVHGMGFSNFFRQLLGKSSDILTPLLGFNIGIELGQLLIVTVIVLLTFLGTNLLKIPHHIWTIGVSSIAGVLSLWLIWQNIFA